MIPLDPPLVLEGDHMHALARRLFPICRSLTGPGVRETLSILQESLPELKIHSVPTGTQAFDWTVPDEWTIRSAQLIGPDGEVVADFAVSNLHVVGYSIPVELELDLEQLQAHLHSLPEQPEAIPYVTSYYRKTWGFCLTHRRRSTLLPGRYRARIDSDLAPGVMNYGELVIPGATADEVLLSTYICHPSMANNELSGPVLAWALARWLQSLPSRRYTYRIVFVPETLGSIVYISRHLAELRARVRAGYVISCVGDERAVSYLESRLGGTLADRAALHVLQRHAPDFIRYSFLERGSDERQYCSAGVDLPVACVMRSKFGTYPEYHTSLDDLNLVSPRGLAGSLGLYQRILLTIENNRRWRTVQPCEPQLGKRGLYPTTSTRETQAIVAFQMDILAYCDGQHDLLSIAERVRSDVADCVPIIKRLAAAGVIECVD